MKKQIFLLSIVLIGLFSCSAAMQSKMEDGYQFGDLSAAQLENLEIYCTSTDPQARAVARAALGHIVGVIIPLNPCGLYDALTPDQSATGFPEPGQGLEVGSDPAGSPWSAPLVVAD